MAYYDLGGYQRVISTQSPDAQLWFDRGLMWAYGFNHEEAIVCFKRATKADPACAMAWWGVAYASGPNYNMPWKLFDPAGKSRALAASYEAAQMAVSLTSGASAAEAALIHAMAARYPQADPIKDQRPWDHSFAAAMRDVLAQFPDDLDVAAILADALLNLTPWKMWDLPTATPGPVTPEAETLLETYLARAGGMQHPGLLHLYVHLMEMAPYPEKALKAGDALRTIAPDAGHLVHMPTHIDVLCGHYENVLRWNEAAIKADLKYYAENGAMNFYTGYRQHNYHFAIYGAMFLGQMEPALHAVKGMADTTPPEMLAISSPPMADFFESYLSMLPHVLIRFGKWDDILALPYPEDRALYCSQVAFIDYARGVALAALGRVAEAEAQQALFEISAAAVPETRLLHNNTVVDLLAIGREMLAGELEYRRGNHDAGFAHLRAAIALEDALNYDEPWGWMQPVRHALGALLLEQGRYAEAEHAFAEDLGLAGTLPRACIHPDNVWALKGLHDCLTAQGKDTQARLIQQRLTLAQARADQPIKAACACAQV